MIDSIYFTERHEWVKVFEGIGSIGITANIADELGEIVHLQFPEVGRLVKQGELIAVMESTKAAIDLYSPVTGTVLAINEPLLNSLSSLTGDSESWFFKILLSHPQELELLMDKDRYQKMLLSS